jgi:hypothetical protein
LSLHDILTLAADDQPLSAFYATAAAAILGLIAMLVAEARGVGEDLRARRGGTASALQVPRLPKASVLVLAPLLLAGELAALHVLAVGYAARWEPVLIWTALASGLVSITIAAALAVSTLRHDTTWTSRLSWLRRWGPPVIGLGVGLVASPFALGSQGSGIRFVVYGTCLTGGCGLIERTGPGAYFPEAARRRRLRDGTKVEVVCQAKGPPPRGYKSDVWDRLANGHYVSDAFIDTPNRSGGFSEELPRC